MAYLLMVICNFIMHILACYCIIYYTSTFFTLNKEQNKISYKSAEVLSICIDFHKLVRRRKQNYTDCILQNNI